MRNLAIGIDIGGSHISSVLVDIGEGKMLLGSYFNHKINNKADANEILFNWSEIIGKSFVASTEDNIVGVGFAMPGPFDYEQGIALFKDVDKYENLFGINVTSELKGALHISADLPFRYMNDATSFAIGEAWQGKASGYKKSVALTLGTGFGSAFLDNGLPIVEREDVPPMGCLWHLPYKDGIADDYFSTRWFVNNYALQTGKKCKGVKEIANEAQSSQVAKDLFIEFGVQLADFLSHWLQLFEAEIVVIGGNMTKAYHLYGEALEMGLSKKGLKIPVEVSEILEASALIGSARLLDESFWQEIKPLLRNM